MRAVKPADATLQTRPSQPLVNYPAHQKHRDRSAIKPDNSNQQLRTLLGAQPGIRLAILFGSMAKGTARPDSDIDIAVLKNQPLTSQEKTALIAEIANLCGRPVDLIDLKHAGEPLLGEILKGERLLGSNEYYARLLTRHLLDAADFLPLQQRILKERRDAWIN